MNALTFLLRAAPVLPPIGTGRVHRIDDSGDKICSRCLVELPIADFYVRADGRHSAQCKPCTRERAAIQQKANVKGKKRA